jgi:hypothetical protein
MSLSDDILKKLDTPGVVSTIRVDKHDHHHGECATKVVVDLMSGQRVEGKFTTHPKSGFGGVTFGGPKDIAGLMVSKIRSVMEGTAE